MNSLLLSSETGIDATMTGIATANKNNNGTRSDGLKPPVTPSKASVSRAGRPVGLRIIAVGFAIAAGTLLCPAQSERFQLGTEVESFDGITFETTRLDAPSVSLKCFTLGAFSLTDTNAPGYGFTLAHRDSKQVKLGIRTLAADDLPRDDAAWAAYIRSVQNGLGVASEVTESLHAGEDEKVVSMLGWDTRELRVTAPPAVPGTEPYVQLHIVASDDNTGVAFVLMGTRSQVEQTERDFRFFLSRTALAEDRG